MDALPQTAGRSSPPSGGEQWVPMTGPVALRADEVHVWRVDIAGGTAAVGLESLSAAERARADRFHFPADRDRFVASHVALRAILASYVDVALVALLFGESLHGKPFVAAPDAGRALRFSLSHSGDIAVVAVSRGHEVGVDVERVRPLDDLDGFAARYFSPAERDALGHVPSADRLCAFFEIWTLKEAYLKACGEGLLRALDAFDVTVGEAPPRLLAVRDRPGDEVRCTSRRLKPPGERYVAGLVTDSCVLRVRQFIYAGFSLGTSSLNTFL
jgi:4'-phosphopantetheinyl transferase